jgi:hypothetical protein
MQRLHAAGRAQGHTDWSGIWEALGTANWDLQDHRSQGAPYFQMGALGAVPSGRGVVEGGTVPYAGIPRATYMPYRAGDFHGDALHVVERFTRTDATHLNYEATIEDPQVFTRHWKIGMPLYRRVERDAQLSEFKCVEYAEELLYGDLRKKK